MLVKGCRLKGGETEIVKHSKPKGEKTEREFEIVRHKLGLGLELYCGIKAIKIGLYSRDKVENYFNFFRTLKFRKTILKLYQKFNKKDGNDMAVDMAQRERNNINCYPLAFSIIQIQISILKFRKCILNYKRNSEKMLVMTWLLMWLNERVATLNSTSQLLVLYRYSLFWMLRMKTNYK